MYRRVVTMLWILPYVMFFSCVELKNSNVASCRDGFYVSENGCAKCPSYCKLCTSNESCTICNDNYFGEYCNKSCKPCVKCHKEYGYCTFGCPDGKFGTSYLTSCSNCSQNCKLCHSATPCIECKPGFYGLTCDRPCPNRCAHCNKTTGLCVRCKEGHFTEYGSCHQCNPDCSACLSERNCSICRHGFVGPYDGQCVEECPNRTETKQVLSKKGQRCGMMTPPTCQKISSHKPYKCVAKRQCMRSCMAQDRCDDDRSNTDRTCGMLMSLNCVHDCQPRVLPDNDLAHADDIEHLCGESCTVDKLAESTPSSPRCFYINGSNPDNSTSLVEDLSTITCFQGTANNPEKEGNSFITIIISNVVGLIVIVVSIIAVLCWYKSRKNRSALVNKSVKQTERNVTDDPEQDGNRVPDSALAMSSLSERYPGIHQEGSSSSTSSNVPGVIQGRLPHGEYMALGARPDRNDYESIQPSDDCRIDQGYFETSGVSVMHDDVQQSSDISVMHDDVLQSSGISGTKQTTPAYVECEMVSEICEKDYLTAI